MLERFGNRFRGVVLLGMILLLSGVFVLQFGGPQAEGCAQGAQGAVAEVYGHSISRNELQSALTLAGGDGYPEELAKQHKLKEMVLYGLIERSLLAKQARGVGFAVEEDKVLERVAEDGILHLSMSIAASSSLPSSGPQRFDFSDKDGSFSQENLRNFIQYRLRRSIREFTRSQVEETLAQRMRDAVTSAVTVASGEVWDAFVREKEGVKLSYVRFTRSYYEQSLAVSPEELSKFIAEHPKEVDAEYEAQKARYTGLEKQVRARHILIKLTHGATDEEKAEKKKTIDALRTRALAGEDFASLAREHSEDTGSKKEGGDLGYNPKGRMVAPFDEAQFALAPGAISEVVESTFGYHVIKVEDVREGDVPLDVAKRELAEKLFRKTRGEELMRAAASALLEQAKTGVAFGDALAAQRAPLPEGAEPDPLAPEVRETRAFGRTDTPIPGPFDSSPLVTAAYQLTEEAPLGKEPITLGDDLFVYRLETRTQANKDEFTAAEQDRIAAGLTQRKREEVLEAYIRELLDAAQRDSAVLVDTTVLEATTMDPNS